MAARNGLHILKTIFKHILRIIILNNLNYQLPSLYQFLQRMRNEKLM